MAPNNQRSRGKDAKDHCKNDSTNTKDCGHFQADDGSVKPKSCTEVSPSTACFAVAEISQQRSDNGSGPIPMAVNCH